MKTLLILGLFLGIAKQASAQIILWDSTSNWKMYDVHDFDAFKYSIKSLDTVQAITLDNNTMRSFLRNVEVWPHDKTSVWMGLYLASCQLPNGEIRKIEISVYGGFLYDELNRTYYQVAENMRQDWLAYLSKNSLILSTNN